MSYSDRYSPITQQKINVAAPRAKLVARSSRGGPPNITKVNVSAVKGVMATVRRVLHQGSVTQVDEDLLPSPLLVPGCLLYRQANLCSRYVTTCSYDRFQQRRYLGHRWLAICKHL